MGDNIVEYNTIFQLELQLPRNKGFVAGSPMLHVDFKK